MFFLSLSNFENVLRIVLAYQDMAVQQGGFPRKGTWGLTLYHLPLKPLMLSPCHLNLIPTQAVRGFFLGSFHLPLHIMALPGALSMKRRAEILFMVVSSPK